MPHTGKDMKLGRHAGGLQRLIHGPSFARMDQAEPYPHNLARRGESGGAGGGLNSSGFRVRIVWVLL